MLERDRSVYLSRSKPRNERILDRSEPYSTDRIATARHGTIRRTSDDARRTRAQPYTQSINADVTETPLGRLALHTRLGILFRSDVPIGTEEIIFSRLRDEIL